MAQLIIDNALLKNTSLSKTQVDTLLKMNAGGVHSLRDHLEKKALTNVEDLLAEVCKVLGVDFVRDISANDISTDLIRNIPISYAKTHEILPLEETDHMVKVLTSNPLNRTLMDDLRLLFKKRIHPGFNTIGSIAHSFIYGS